MMKQFILLAASLLCAAQMLSAQSQPIYWSTTQPNCGSFASRHLDNGGYVCEHLGIFPWYASGGAWKSAIRTQAPSSGAIGVVVSYYDTGSNPVALDSFYYGGNSFYSRNVLSFALSANEPVQLDIAGLGIEYPRYNTTASGVALVLIQAPDAKTCSEASAQLLYSALPFYPWSLSIPIAWEDHMTNGYSAVGMDDGGAQAVSIVVFNDGQIPGTFMVHVYDGGGTEISGSPASITLGAGGTVGKLLRDLMPSLPKGIFRIKVTGSNYGRLEALQFNGPSATSLSITAEGTLPPRVTGDSYSGVSARRLAASEIELTRVHDHVELSH